MFLGWQKDIPEATAGVSMWGVEGVGVLFFISVIAPTKLNLEIRSESGSDPIGSALVSDGRPSGLAWCSGRLPALGSAAVHLCKIPPCLSSCSPVL